MIYTDKNHNSPPTILIAPDTRKSLKKVADYNRPNHKKGIIQRIYANDEVVSRLKSIYKNKCAYCESFEFEPEMDHYRPKGAVDGEPGHIGYYWLCYEWTNLLPACHECNKPGSKGVRFPIAGKRETAPPLLPDGRLNHDEFKLLSNTLLKNERPLLLNPEIPGFDPFTYFKFKSNGAIVESPVPGTAAFERAKNTISVVRLDRPYLRQVVRENSILYYIRRMTGYLVVFLGKGKQPEYMTENVTDILTEIKGRTDSSEAHSFFWSYLYANFNELVIENLDKRYWNWLFQIVADFKRINP